MANILRTPDGEAVLAGGVFSSDRPAPTRGSPLHGAVRGAEKKEKQQAAAPGAKKGRTQGACRQAPPGYGPAAMDCWQLGRALLTWAAGGAAEVDAAAAGPFASRLRRHAPHLSGETEEWIDALLNAAVPGAAGARGDVLALLEWGPVRKRMEAAWACSACGRRGEELQAAEAALAAREAAVEEREVALREAEGCLAAREARAGEFCGRFEALAASLRRWEARAHDQGGTGVTLDRVAARTAQKQTGYPPSGTGTLDRRGYDWSGPTQPSTPDDGTVHLHRAPLACDDLSLTSLDELDGLLTLSLAAAAAPPPPRAPAPAQSSSDNACPSLPYGPSLGGGPSTTGSDRPVHRRVLSYQTLFRDTTSSTTASDASPRSGVEAG
eukprot:TRINITY_DN29980_c0_g1_i1.p1 TRINITY_DN29980_c0_g1~~TRINITY_DN29980_c0_g1_i1.p1  ORF type:complete len:407 (+),score=113.80 TRINITY_DN29980_c0_g1_i1:78-1223(+)